MRRVGFKPAPLEGIRVRHPEKRSASESGLYKSWPKTQVGVPLPLRDESSAKGAKKECPRGLKPRFWQHSMSELKLRPPKEGMGNPRGTDLKVGRY